MKIGEPWSKDEINFLKDNYRTMKNNEISSILSRSIESIKNSAKKLGLKKIHHYNHFQRKFLGMGYSDISDTKYSKAKKLWQGMLARCYNPKVHNRQPKYIGCTVCDEWLLYSNFKQWVDDPQNGYKEGYCLDKDIIVKGNRIYSPDTCCFVPKFINNIFTDHSKGLLPIGVQISRGKYVASLSKYSYPHYIGTFDTIDDASKAYQQAKRDYIYEIADKFYATGEITERVYIAMKSY